MTYYPDLSRIPEERRVTLVAVGWLDPSHRYDKGAVDERFVARLFDLLVEPWQPFAMAGRHPCGFCRFSGGPGVVAYSRGAGTNTVTVGAANLFVPGSDVLYMAPSLIVHYVDAHEYAPPREFSEAVLACPTMKTADYLKALRAVGGAKLLRPPAASNV